MLLAALELVVARMTLLPMPMTVLLKFWVFMLEAAPIACNVPPFSVRAPELAAMMKLAGAPDAEKSNANLPPLMVVMPVYRLEPVSVTVP